MHIHSELLPTGNRTIDLRGRWVSNRVIERVKHATNVTCFNAHMKAMYVERGLLSNEIFINFSKTDRLSDIEEVVDYLNTIINPVIGTAFTEITVSPYVVPNNNNENGLGLLREIAHETRCAVDWGQWNMPVTFKPESNTQFNAVVALLDLFELNHSEGKK